MRFYAFFFFLLFAIQTCFSQNSLLQTKVSLKLKSVDLNDILKEISKKYGINFSYVNDLIPAERRIVYKCRDQTLKEVLDEILREANLDYQQVGNQVVLKRIDHEIKIPKAKLYQTIRGEVIDKHSLTLLPGATIYLLGEKDYKFTNTNNDGKFRMERVPLGRYDLKVTYIGYKEYLVSDIILNSGKEIVLSISMEQNIVEGETVTVYAQKDKSAPNNDLILSSVTNIKPETLTRFAGARLDPSRVVANYAGVINGRDPRNDIIVRGNSSYGVLWRLEGVDIPNPNHYSFVANSGGAFSILNNNHLASSDFITSAFPAEYGNKTSAVMDVKLRNGNNEKREYTVQAGLSGLEFSTEGPMGKGGASYLAGVRYFDYKLLDLVGLQFAYYGVPKFSDATFKFFVPTKRKGTFTLWGISGQSGISVKEAGMDTIKWGKAKFVNHDKLSSSMYAYGLSHTYNYHPHVMGRLNISTSRSDIRFANNEIYRNSVQRSGYSLKNIEGQNLINYSLSFYNSPVHHYKAGITFKHLFYNNEDLILLPDSSSINGLKRKGDSYFVQSFINWQYKITSELELNSGLYYQFFGYNNKWTIEPRAALKYQFMENQNITLAAGIHSQTQPLAYYQYQTPDSIYKFSDYNRKLGFTKSVHLVAGYTYSINEDWRLKAEAYYQYQYKVPVTLMKSFGSYSALNEGAEYNFSVYDSTVNKGTGKNMGFELTFEKFFSNQYYFITSFTVLDSKYKGADGIERNTTFDIDHILNILGGKAFDLDGSKRKQLFIDGKMNFAGGRRFIPVDEVKTANDPNDIVYYDYNNAYKTKVKDYFRTDIKLTFNVNRPKATHNLFFAIDNILNTKNESIYDWNRMEGRVKEYYQTGIFPYLGYKIQF